jgi:hypothetical protein
VRTDWYLYISGAFRAILERANLANLSHIKVYDVKACDQRLQASNSGVSCSVLLYHVEAAKSR